MYLQNYYGYNDTTYCWPKFGAVSQYYSRPNWPIPRPLTRRNGLYYIGPVRRPPWRQEEPNHLEVEYVQSSEENVSVDDDCHDYNNNDHKGSNNEDSGPLAKKRRVGNPVDDRRGMPEIRGEHVVNPCIMEKIPPMSQNTTFRGGIVEKMPPEGLQNCPRAQEHSNKLDNPAVPPSNSPMRPVTEIPCLSPGSGLFSGTSEIPEESRD